MLDVRDLEVCKTTYREIISALGERERRIRTLSRSVTENYILQFVECLGIIGLFVYVFHSGW